MSNSAGSDEGAVNPGAVHIEVRNGADTVRTHRVHPHAVREDRCAPLRGGHAEGGNIEEDEVRFDRARVKGDAGHLRQPFRKDAGVRVILRQPRDVVFERIDAT